MCTLKDIFLIAEIGAGLALKPPKCVIIPLHGGWKQSDGVAVRDELRSINHEWEHFRIGRHGTYLGASLGPEAGSNTWTMPRARWEARAREWAASEAPACALAARHASECTSVLTYAASLANFLDSLDLSERDMTCRLLRT